MTEDEAKTKWCPHVRLMSAGRLDEYGAPEVPQPQTTFNRIAVSGQANPWRPAQGACIASECMAWRWDYDQYGDATEGFCGLAGRP